MMCWWHFIGIQQFSYCWNAGVVQKGGRGVKGSTEKAFRETQIVFQCGAEWRSDTDGGPASCRTKVGGSGPGQPDPASGVHLWLLLLYPAAARLPESGHLQGAVERWVFLFSSIFSASFPAQNSLLQNCRAAQTLVMHGPCCKSWFATKVTGDDFRNRHSFTASDGEKSASSDFIEKSVVSHGSWCCQADCST